MLRYDHDVRPTPTAIRTRRLIARHLALVAVICLTGACSSEPTGTSPLGVNGLVLRGTVITANGQRAVGASVRSHAFRADCTTPISVERDTLLVTDASGSFKGYLTADPVEPHVSSACVQIAAQKDGGGVASQTLQVEFRPSEPSGANLDTASVVLNLP